MFTPPGVSWRQELTMRIDQFKTVQEVVDWRLCLGCGACASICPEDNIQLWNILEEGIRPEVTNTDCNGCRLCLEVCPAIENDHRPLLQSTGLSSEAMTAFGPVLEIWEGHAADPEIRYRGSSGGILTALSLYCLEKEGMFGALHIGSDPENAMRNRTRISRSRDELLNCAGSRYAPASACDGLRQMEQAPGPCVFIGQPSEVTALRKVEAKRPELSKNVGLALSFFCAGTPAARGTIDFVQQSGFEPNHVGNLRYRGNGWPGMFAVQPKGGEEKEITTYAKSWGFLQKFRPFAVHLVPDFSGEDADIASGDPWYRTVGPDEAGSSIIVVRTERGREILKRAREAGYVILTASDSKRLIDSQTNIIRRRGAIWGRLLAMRLLGIPAPRLYGFSLFKNWLDLSLQDQAKSLFGTIRRALQRGYRKPRPSMLGNNAERTPVPMISESK